MFSVVVALAATSLALLITFPLALPVVWLLFVSARAMAAVERSRLASLLGERLTDPVPRWWPAGRGAARRAPGRSTAGARSPTSVLALPSGIVTTVGAAVAWCGRRRWCCALYVSDLPGGTAKFWLFEVGAGPAAYAATVVGLGGLVVARGSRGCWPASTW